jgi:hypothetical protein
MDVLTLLAEAQEAGLTVEAHDGNLRVRGPRTAAALAQRIGEHKAAILAALAPGDGPMPRADRETARFLRLAVPDGNDWHVPATRAPVMPPVPIEPTFAWLTSEQAARLPPDVAALVTARVEWTPRGMVGRLNYLARRVEESDPDRAAVLRLAANLIRGRAVEGFEEILRAGENPG